MKKIIVATIGLILAGAMTYGLLQLELVSHAVTPRRYWRKKILNYQKELEKAKKVTLIKHIQLKKKIMTGELDVAQDVILGIDEQMSVSVVQGEIEELKRSIVDSEQAVRDLQIRLTEAKERFNTK